MNRSNVPAVEHALPVLIIGHGHAALVLREIAEREMENDSSSVMSSIVIG